MRTLQDFKATLARALLSLQTKLLFGTRPGMVIIGVCTAENATINKSKRQLTASGILGLHSRHGHHRCSLLTHIAQTSVRMPMQRKPRYFALSTVAAHGTGFRQPMLPLKLLEDAWRLQRPVSLAVQRDKFIPNPFHVPEGQEQRAAHKNDTKMLVQAFKCKVFRVIGSCCSLNGTKHGQGLAAQKTISYLTSLPVRICNLLLRK